MIYSTGANKSKLDIRTFSYVPVKTPVRGGVRYLPEDIEHQYSVGICTSISLTQNARKALGRKFSAEFQYLCQKKFYDLNWDEGSSILHALKVAKNIGLLPEEEWTFTTEEDRKLGYQHYIDKLKTISDQEIERLKGIATNYKIKAYASVPIDRDLLANATDESKAGLLVRFNLGKEWWTEPIEPLRTPQIVISGHAVSDTRYNGNSRRIANSWGKDWADGGTAYYLLNDYFPTEAWIIYFQDAPPKIDEKLEKRKQIQGKILDLLQKVVELLLKLKKSQ